MAGKAAEAQKLRVFISYSRRDMARADELVGLLEANDISVLIDRRDLPYGEEWQRELSEFIRSSDAVIWLVSPSSVASKMCNWELGEVSRLNKRLVPATIVATDPGTLPKALGKIHLLPAVGVFDPKTHLATLVDVLNTDLDWLKVHTRLSDRAHEWLLRDRSAALLLRGVALGQAEQWREQCPEDEHPSEFVLDLILASRQAATRRQRYWIGGLFAITVGALALAGFAVLQQQEAERQRVAAVEQRKIAEKNEARANEERNRALVENSRMLASRARSETAQGDAITSALLSLEALPASDSTVTKPKTDQQTDRPVVPEVEEALYEALTSIREIQIKRHSSAIAKAQFSPDDRFYFTMDSTQVHLWKTSSGALHKAIDIGTYVRCVRVSSDGSLLLIVPRNLSGDRHGFIWDVEAGVRQATLSLPAAGQCIAAFSPDSKLVATTGADNIPRIWRTKDGRMLQEMKGHEGGLLHVEFHPSGDRIVSSSYDGTARIWSVADGKQIGIFRQDENMGAINVATFDPSGQYLAAGGADNKARIWNLATGSEKVLTGHQNHVLALRYSPDGKWLLSGSYDRTARVWETSSGALRHILAGHRSPIRHVAFSSDGKLALTSPTDTVSSLDSAARLWNAETGQQFAVLGGHAGGIEAAAFSSDNKLIITSSKDGTARVWRRDFDIRQRFIDSRGERQIRKFVPGPDRLYAFSLFGGDGKQEVNLWDVARRKLVRTFHGHDLTTVVTGVKISRDGAFIAGLQQDGTTLIWDFNSGQEITRFEMGWNAEDTAQLDAGLKTAAFWKGSEVVVHDISKGVTVQRFFFPKKPMAIRLSPDGERLTVAQDDGKALRIFDIKSGSAIYKDPGTGSPKHARDFEILGSENYFLRGHSDVPEHANLYLAETGKLVSRLAHKAIPTSLFRSFHPFSASKSGKAVLGSHSRSKRILEVYDIQSGRALCSFDDHDQYVNSGRFSPDGTLYVTASNDMTARVWRSTDCRPVHTLRHTEFVNRAVFNSAQSVVYTLARLAVHRWPLYTSTADMARGVLATAPRCLTLEQRRAAGLLPEPPRWCITGPNKPDEPDPAKWQPKWPFDTREWRDWQIAKDAGESRPMPDG